jgi:hypothetical protein
MPLIDRSHDLANLFSHGTLGYVSFNIGARLARSLGAPSSQNKGDCRPYPGDSHDNTSQNKPSRYITYRPSSLLANTVIVADRRFKRNAFENKVAVRQLEVAICDIK